MTYTDQQRKRIAAAVGRQRRAKKLDKEPAARAADVSSITWKRVEDGESVRDGSLAKILDSLGLPSIDELLDDNSEAQPLALIPDEDLAAEFLRRMKGARHGLESTTQSPAPPEAVEDQEEARRLADQAELDAARVRADDVLSASLKGNRPGDDLKQAP
ncbi:hypothetical protein [Mycolicibacterium gilvum]|uniref:hypothetical protein n=1 Tax=Mycolicibacterium gilvum TaxID=1804 RepID=UPI0040462B32